MMMTSSAWVFLLVTILLLLLLRASSDQLEKELEEHKNALTYFITHVDHDSSYNWDTSEKKPCNWKGVECLDDIVIISLRMPSAKLVGKIPLYSIGKITSLRHLSLHGNSLSGPIPDDFASLTQLRSVYLHNNKFSGQFSSSLAHWTKLITLDLSDNSFSGELPDNVVSSSRLVNFNVSNNKLSGRLPDNVLSSSTLVNFSVSYNRFSGSLPDVAPSKELKKFNVSNNDLSGPIPSSLARFQDTAFSGNSKLCGKPLSKTCNNKTHPPSSSPSPSPSGSLSSDDKKKKKLSTGHIVGIAVGSTFILIICSLCLGKKWSRVVKEKKTPGVAKMAAEAEAMVREARTSSLKDDVTGASMEGERNK